MEWMEYIRKVGVAKVAETLGVTRQTVYNWLSGRFEIKRKEMKELIDMAGGELSFKDFYE